MDYAQPILDKNGNPALANPGTDVPRFSTGPNGNTQRATTKWVEDGSYVRLKNISLSYNLSPSVLSKQNVIKGIKATVGIQNALTITRYSGFDPEVGSYVGPNVGADTQAVGLDYGRYPLTPIYTFGINVNF